MPIGRFWRRRQWDRERSEEIESYLRIETDENVARGLPLDEARAAALRKLGNRTAIREEIYGMNTIALLDGLARDTRYSLRSLGRSPMFTAAALVTLAIGIGANSAVFSVVNSVLVRPLRYPRAEQLVELHQDAPGAAGLANAADGCPSRHRCISCTPNRTGPFRPWAYGFREPRMSRAGRSRSRFARFR